MSSLTFPDTNVWMAILLADHIHRRSATEWWGSDASETLGFVRLTQLGVLRLLTTSAAMSDRPLTMREAWAAYDRLFDDDRVAFVDEPAGVEGRFRALAGADAVSPKLWADAWLLAFAEAAGGTIVTFDRALAGRSAECVLLV